MWIFNAIANAVGKNFIGTPNYLFGLLFNRVQADGGVTEAQQCTINELTELQNENLLSSASLVLTPSSYKESKLYSLIPTNGNGDFTFTRATTATRVNSSGLVELVPYNLLQRSEQFDNATWSKGPNVTITENTVVAPNGTLTADSINVTSTSAKYIFQDITYSGSYTFSIYAKYQSLQFIQLLISTDTTKFVNFDILNGLVTRQDNSVGTIENVGNGWFRCSISLNATSQTQVLLGIIGSGNATRVQSNSLVGTSYIWGAQLVEGSTALPYQKTETRLNIPRLDYSLGGCPNILLEPQRTNLALRSQEFDNASWVKVNASVTANTTTSPDGTSNADSLVENTATNLHLTYQFFTSTATTYTYSCYIKPDTRTRAYLRTDTSAGTTRTLFDLTGAGSVVTLAHTSATITLVGSGWYRCTITFTEGTGAANRLFAVEGAVGTSISYAGNGLTAFYLYGAQLEVGAYATSYIPTTSASVTRNADVITRNNIYTNGLISASGGTWFVDIKNNFPLKRDSSSYEIALKNSIVFNNGCYIRNASGSESRLTLVFYSGGTTVGPYITETNNFKAAFVWNGTTASIFVNGVKVINNVSFTLTNFEFLETPSTRGVTNFLNATSLWNTPLTDTECIQLTTI